ncbi:gamma-glutamylcyclotransferase [Streptomyces sp. NBC_01476]|uniref:gamma-glutamylcyclotransferase family protein n=1 Tax=Streptomyces sp. NBC_01476 TaxID=2903881 RepID=UPI002E32CE77|nr:gamma-glutamylcyclotransferase family protein [Streptomyces sp. NBC_01476]
MSSVLAGVVRGRPPAGSWQQGAPLMDEPRPGQWPFFVYGTLRPGTTEHSWMFRGLATSELPAVLHDAELYEGPDFPCAVAKPNGGRVRGEAIQVPDDVYDEMLAGLDQMMDYSPGNPGAAVERVAREVRTTNGASVTAWVYLATARTAAELEASGRRITSGDWQNR